MTLPPRWTAEQMEFAATELARLVGDPVVGENVAAMLRQAAQAERETAILLAAYQSHIRKMDAALDAARRVPRGTNP